MTVVKHRTLATDMNTMLTEFKHEMVTSNLKRQDSPPHVQDNLDSPPHVQDNFDMMPKPMLKQ